jgi:flagellar protein FliO/FliZ
MNRFIFVAAPILAAMGSAQAATDPVPSAGSVFQVLFGLIVVLGLMAGAAWLMKRFGVARSAGNSVARIVGGVSVGNRERVLVVEVADQWFVVGVAAGRVNALGSMPRQEHSAALEQAHPVAPNFSAWLKQTIDKRNGRQ